MFLKGRDESRIGLIYIVFQDDERLDDQPPDLVRASDHGAFLHGRMFDQGIFYFKWADRIS